MIPIAADGKCDRGGAGSLRPEGASPPTETCAAVDRLIGSKVGVGCGGGLGGEVGVGESIRTGLVLQKLEREHPVQDSTVQTKASL